MQRQPDSPNWYTADKIAKKTGWSTAKAGLTSVNTTRLVQKDQNVLLVKITSRTVAFFSGLMLSSLVAGLAVVTELLQTQAFNTVFIPLMVCAVFFMVGVVSLFRLSQPMVFDRQRGYFWRGHKGKVAPTQIIKGAKPLARIHALQVLSGRGQYHTDNNCELNLVMSDSSRINVMEHTCLITLSEDARKLAKFLQVPIWGKI
jgi:hypothetical protein